MTIKVNGKEFKNLKEAQDYDAQLKADPNYVAPVQTKLEDAIEVATGSDQTVETLVHTDSEGNVYVPCEGNKDDLAEQIDSLTDEDPELAEELDVALDEDADMKDGNEVPDHLEG